MSLLRRMLATGTEQRAQHVDLSRIGSSSLADVAFGNGLTSRLEWEHDAALRVSTVYACVSLLADTVAGLPVDVFRRRADAREPVEPVPAVIRKPSTTMTRFDWLHTVMSSLLIHGNAFLLVVRAGDAAVALEPLAPALLDVEIEGGKLVYRVARNKMAPGAVLHVRGFTIPGEPLGLSPIQMMARSLGIWLEAERFSASWYVDGAAPSAVLQTDQDLTPEQAIEIQARWLANHQGRRRPAVLPKNLKYQAVTLTPEESQFLEAQRFTTEQLLGVYRVPPHMIGLTEKSTSWGSGIEQQALGFVRFALMPWLSRLEQALTPLLPGQQTVCFNVDGLQRADMKSRYAAYGQARAAGILTTNEIRALENLPPVPEGDGLLQPLNMGPLGSDPLALKGGDDPASEPQEV